jgi:hypothetical protein
MAKRTISFKDYQEPTWEDYTGEDPPVGKWFNAVAKKAKYLEEDDQLQIIFEINDGDYKGWGRGMYLPLDPGDNVYWKTQATIKAVQGGVAKDVTVDFENQKALDAWVAKLKPVKLKTEEYNDKVRIAKVAPMLASVPDKAAAKKEAELPDEVDAGDEPIEDYTAEELADMEVAELEEILSEEFELPKDDDDFPKKSRRDRDGSKYKAELIEAILAEQESDDEGGDDEGGEDQEEFEDGFDEGGDADEEPEPEPEPAKPARRSRATKATPAKAAAPVKATTTTRRRRS